MHLEDLQQLSQLNTNITGLRVKTDHLYQALNIAHHLEKELPIRYFVSNWTEQYGDIIKTIALRKRSPFASYYY